jgi:phosphohistidine phosphatase
VCTRASVSGMTHGLELLRHAKSSWDDPGLADRDRPLAPRGIKACTRLRKHMRKSGLAPDLVLCSSAARAVQTLEGIRDGLAVEPKVQIDESLYGADDTRLLARLNDVPESAESVLLIGHNPALVELALVLAGDGEADALQRMRSKYPTGGLASLTFDGAWRGLERGVGRLEAFVVPRELK